MKKLTTADEINDLLNASTASAALGAAVETGLPWLLAEKPLDGEAVAQALHIPLKRCHYWLQLLEELGILEKGPQGYNLTALARSAILGSFSRESWKYLTAEERERSAGIHNLARYIHEPGSFWKVQGLTRPRDYVEAMRADANQAREFTRMLYELHHRLAEELAAHLDLSGVHRLLDVGGGSGVVAMACLRRYPALTATVADIENVCMAGREIAAETPLAGRITYQPVEFDREEFPTGFDMVLLCDVGVFGEAFFRKLRNSLNDGGRLVIVWHFPESENAAPRSRIEWTFLDSLEDPNFAFPTVLQTHVQLLNAGFTIFPGGNTLPDRRIVIQAQK